jgi:hypothetical protein
MIYIPTRSPDDWKHLLSDPEKHWKDGFSAKELALSWEKQNDFPKKIREVLDNTGTEIFSGIKIILGIPEYKVNLKGGKRASQNDLFVLASTDNELITIMVEGKVSESFGPLVCGWNKTNTTGKEERLNYLCGLLSIDVNIVGNIRYQLIHRTASAVLTAHRFHCNKALVLIHSFSINNYSFKDYTDFLRLFMINAIEDSIVGPYDFNGIKTYWGWINDNLSLVKLATQKNSRHRDSVMR